MSHAAPGCSSLLSLQIFQDLLFFRGSHRKEFESRWKSFTLVKKSLEDRVSVDVPLLGRVWTRTHADVLSRSFTGRSSTCEPSSSTACCCSTRWEAPAQPLRSLGSEFD